MGHSLVGPGRWPSSWPPSSSPSSKSPERCPVAETLGRAGTVPASSRSFHREFNHHDPCKRLVNTHFSPLSGHVDAPENYHTLTWTLEPEDGMTRLTLAQDNNASPGGAAHSKGIRDRHLASVKEMSERS
ncbi:SRPBCC domain-containing protein [Arthrobacter sp. SRS-W-1-2016]|uniref:SRPBCC domain-containing protein n=1 Tax=Arthrobacter sp. SRS-W-1-2016 TaxID=1930254 RepID=UPI001C0CE802|nr:SRPBCC domain-containing protein [Arthrobacter sp. SRS-W-1-2016]